jgi:hypothetical protein
MNLPRLTAELSLYQSGTHYRTNARTSLVWSSSRTIRTAQGGTGTQGETGGEIIYVHGCLPGEVKIGNSCVDPGGDTLPPITVPAGQGPQGGGGKGHGPKGHGPPKKKGNGLHGGDYNPTIGSPCCSMDPNVNRILSGNYSYSGKAGWACCNPRNTCDSCSMMGRGAFCEDGSCPSGLGQFS